MFQGQELSSDVDEKSLLEVGIKDCQLVFLSQGAIRGTGHLGSPSVAASRSSSDSLPPFPGREKMPMNLLLLPRNFDQLFSLMQNLSNMKQTSDDKEGVGIPKAQILSRRVWDILMLLPTNPDIKRALLDIGQSSEDDIRRLLNPDSPQKLMYTLYIVDWLGRPSRLRRHSKGMAALAENNQPWIDRFISAGGLQHLFRIFSSGQLQNWSSDPCCEWKQDCLSTLLKLLVQFGVDAQDYEAFADQLLETVAGSPVANPKKKLKRQHSQQNRRHASGSASGGSHLLVPRLSSAMLQMMHIETIIPRLVSVLLDASSRNKDIHLHYRTGMFGRCQVSLKLYNGHNRL